MKTKGSILIQRDANKWPGILESSRIFEFMFKYIWYLPSSNLYFNIILLFVFQDLNKKILIVHGGNDERLRKTWTELKRLEEMQVKSCHCADLISVCTQETFLLIFLEMSSVSGHAQKLCSTLR